jgi:hypothetical protein
MVEPAVTSRLSGCVVTTGDWAKTGGPKNKQEIAKRATRKNTILEQNGQIVIERG